MGGIFGNQLALAKTAFLTYSNPSDLAVDASDYAIGANPEP